MNYNIIQIIPAQDWFVCIESQDKDGEYQENHYPLVCWALHSDADGDRFVAGMYIGEGGFIDLCENHKDFVRYDYRPIVILNSHVRQIK